MTNQKKLELLKEIRRYLTGDYERPAGNDEIALVDDLIRDEDFNRNVGGRATPDVDIWCLTCATHGHTEYPPRHDNRRHRMELETALRIVEEYEDDPYERIEGTWIGAGNQMFYRDKKDGAIYVDSSGHKKLTKEEINSLKDIRVLKVE